jgi:hypothetical protein
MPPDLLDVLTHRSAAAETRLPAHVGKLFTLSSALPGLAATRARACRGLPRMTKSTRLFTTLAFLAASTLAACGGTKTPPKSTTTTRTQTETTTDSGDNSTTDSTEKTTINADGSTTTTTNENTNTSAPAASPK